MILALLLLALVAGGAAACLQQKVKSNSEGGISSGSCVSVPAESRQAQLAEAADKNSNIVAWLYIPDTEIDNPVVQAEDNEYYLHRDETGSNDVWGCYFVDYWNDLSSRNALDTNTVIYAHSYKTEDPNERKFTQLFKYCDLSFVQKHPYIYLSVKGEDLAFAVSAVFFTDIAFNYTIPQPAGEDLTSFFANVARKNEYAFNGLDFGPMDKILTLSTCAYRYDQKDTGNHRLVVMAKLLAQGESAQKITVSAKANPERP